MANQDGSDFEPDRIANVQIYSTTDLTLSFADWDPLTNAPVLTNGVLLFDLPATGDDARFWRAVEQP
ncbi:hypothetical protein SBV1_2930010 [Verrucomicrobia bacterium]|nr:hypothetical protein SBV1_2930010 [Verrucomicrobiota bacterium]